MSQQNISQLAPSIVWRYFQEICAIPHPSYYEKEIVQYLKKFAEQMKLECTLDTAGNILIRKPATSGKENFKVVLLQAHMDMVPQKNNDSNHDFEKDPIKVYIDGDFVTADGTTLGADNGLGMAAMLAVLASNNIEHGPIEALFTSDEEVGLTGATRLASDLLSADILFNLDTEHEGELFIGCSGGQNMDIHFPYKSEKLVENQTAFQIKISGLQGGHSGIDIHLGLGNAIKMLAEILREISKATTVHLAKIEGGSIQHNAIPREASAIIAVAKEDQESVELAFAKGSDKIIVAFKKADPKIAIKLESADLPETTMLDSDQVKLIAAINQCPNGVIAMSKKISGLTETSTNIAYITTKLNEITLHTSQRSSIETDKQKIVSEVEKVFSNIGAEVKLSASYPGWQPSLDSEILALSTKLYESMFDKKPIIKAVHGGLECGILGSKYPTLDMISFGPTIQFPHSPDERIEIASVQKFWDFLIELLKNI